MSFSLDQLLIFAARSGNYRLAQERLNSGADPNYLDPSHGSAALESVRRADIQMLSLLLEGGLTSSGPAALAGDGLIEAALYFQQEAIAIHLTDHGFRLLPHSRSIYRERLEHAFVRRRTITP